VLRSVRTVDEGGFIPQLDISVSIGMAFACVATLMYFVGHMSGRVNVDTVVGLVSDDVQAVMRSVTTDEAHHPRMPPSFWHDAVAVADNRDGYLHQLDENGLATWARENEERTAPTIFRR
jgi:uncharacterized membrane protein